MWNTGATGSVTSVSPAINTTYTLFGTSAEGCMASRTIAISTRSVPVIKISQSRDSVCKNEPVVLKASGAASYTWLPGFNQGNTDTVYPSASSVFNVIGRSVNSCTQAGIAYVFVDECLGLSETDLTSGCKVFPNPSNGIFKIVFADTALREFFVYDAGGDFVLNLKSADKIVGLDLSGKSAGLYILNVQSHEKVIWLKLLRD